MYINFVWDIWNCILLFQAIKIFIPDTNALVLGWQVFRYFLFYFLLQFFFVYLRHHDLVSILFNREVPGTPTTSKMHLFVALVNGLQPLTDVTNKSILDIVGVLDTPLNKALSVTGCLLYTWWIGLILMLILKKTCLFLFLNPI